VCILLPFLILYHSLYYACFIEETLTLASAIRAGAENIAGISRERYMARLEWLKQLSRLHIFYNKDERGKSVFFRISALIESLKLDDSNGKVRKQPYGVLLAGPPGCGKTITAMRFAEKFLRAKYGEFNPHDIVTLNETDEYQSEYRTNHRVVIFDDVAAEQYAKAMQNPWRKIIDFINNVKKTALNPNVDLKGVVYINPDLVIVTTNMSITQSFGLSSWINCIGAIERRFPCILQLEPDFKHCFEADRQIRERNNLDRCHQACTKVVQNHVRRLLDEVIDEHTNLFVVQQAEQEEFVNGINSHFDVPRISRGFFSAFYSDVIQPFVPDRFRTKVIVQPLSFHADQLGDYTKKILPSGHMTGFRFPYTNHLNSNKLTLRSQSGYRSDNIDEEMQLAQELEIARAKRLNLEVYFNQIQFDIFSPMMSGSFTKFIVLPDGFYDYPVYYIAPDTSNKYPKIFSNPSYEYTFAELKEYSEELELINNPVEESNESSDAEEDALNVGLLSNTCSEELKLIHKPSTGSIDDSDDEEDALSVGLLLNTCSEELKLIHKPSTGSMDDSDDEEDALSVVLNSKTKIDLPITNKALKRALYGLFTVNRNCFPDKYADILMATKPKKFQFIFKEWVALTGRGDFVFHYKRDQNIPTFIVLELKSDNYEKCYQQAIRYGTDFASTVSLAITGRARVYAVAMTPDKYSVHKILGSNPATNRVVDNLIGSWYNKFSSHCGVTRDVLCEDI